MNVHIEGHINWTNSTANFITTGTLSAGAGTLDSLTLDLTQDYLFCERGTVLCVQGQTAATASQFELYSNDGDGTDSVYLATFGVGTPAGVTNSESLYFGYDAVNSRTAIASLASGTGTVRPMHLYTGANTTQLVLNIDGSNSMAGALGVTGAVTGGSFSTAGDITTTAGTLYVPGSIIHYGDADTLIAFSAPDQYYFQAGGWQFMLLSKSAKSQSALTINAGQEDLDTTISGVTEANLFRVDAATDTVRMGDWDTNYNQWTSAGVQTMAGTARVTKQIWLPFNALKEPGTKPATFKEWGISGAWEFSDATDDTIVFNIAFPEDMDMSVAPVMCLGWSTNTAVDTETATWQLEYLYTQAGEDTTAVAQGTITVDSNAIAQANGLIIAQLPAMGVPNAADICLHGRLKRLGAGGNDDLTDTAELHGVSLQYTSNKLGTGT